MSIKVSPNSSKDNIRVGYIDPKLGYVDNVTISQANVYARENPRTKFIFRDGNNVLNYLSINQVNKLTGKDLLSTKECEGIENKEIRTPLIQFSGGGGIGALANPIVGNDGSILAVDLEYGGNGYQYPPIASADDFSGFGSGAVFEVSLGEIAKTILDCDGFDDIEEYDDSGEVEFNFGRIYGQNGNDLGKWNPRSYLITQEDPTLKQVEEYIRILNAQQRTPFWTTRKRLPDRAFSDSNRFKVSRIYNDSDSRWDKFLNKYAISPIPRSRVTGSDFTGITFTMEWDEDFPHDGEYIFRGLADNFGTLYLDNDRINLLGGLEGPVLEIKKTITRGRHTIKLELLNEPITESEVGIRNDTVGKFVNVTFYVSGQGDRSNQYGFKFISEDGSHSFSIVRPDQDGITNSIDIGVKQKTNYKVQQFSTNRSLIQVGTLPITNPKNQPSREIFADGIGTENGSNDIRLRSDIGFFTPTQLTPIKGRDTFAMTYRVDEGKSGLNSVENPVAVALTIDAPIPPIPQLPPVAQDGPCPPNPFWTTRVQNSKNLWYPAVSEKFWEKFMNRYAISPVPPLNSGDNGVGKIFKNSWRIDAPYSGIYGFRGTADYVGKFFVDGVEIATLEPPKTKTPKLVRFLLSKGPHTIEIQVQNDPLTVTIPEPPPTPTPTATPTSDFVDVTFNISTSSGAPGDLKCTFMTDDGSHSFTINASLTNNTRRTEVIKVKPNSNYRVLGSSGPTAIEQGTIVGGRKGRGNLSNTIFVDRLTSADDFNDLVITSSLGTFVPGNTRNVSGTRKGRVENRISFDLTYRIIAPVPSAPPLRVPPPPITPIPWGENPIGVSAIIIAPCCPKNVGGRGIVDKVIVKTPGTGYPAPTPIVPVYPVALALGEVIIEDPGINYGPDDEITITPDNGASLEFTTNPLGQVESVNIINPGFGFTVWPTITISGGVNAKLRPVFEIIRDPIVVDESKLIQVTDLVGLKQTGYINGRPYYGSVFFKDNVKFAGFYETVGDLVQVYDTLKESIDAQVTTPPSAIQRQGTDVTSNDPRLNIPGTPQNLI